MTATIEPEAKSTSRRALLASAIGGMGALVASAIGRPSVVRANDPNDVVLGSSANTETTTTKITNSTTGETVFYASSTSGIGVYGFSHSMPGVVGNSIDGAGVFGVSGSYFGVYGTSNSGMGVGGRSDSATGTGVFAEVTDTGSSENYGLAARTHSSKGRAVFGWSLSTAGGTGVWGQTNAGGGAAVRGYAWDGGGASGQFGTGVMGTSGSHAFPPPVARANTGVMGVSPTGTGGYFYSATGTALHADGKLFASQFVEMREVGAPSAPGANHARIFLRDNGSGKTQLCVRFATGKTKVLATEG